MEREALKLAFEWFQCYADKSMSRNNAEALADEVIEAITAALAQPAQEPDALTIAYQSGYHDGKKAALAGPQREQNFCPRCGKRTNNIHTCTSPQGAS